MTERNTDELTIQTAQASSLLRRNSFLQIQVFLFSVIISSFHVVHFIYSYAYCNVWVNKIEENNRSFFLNHKFYLKRWHSCRMHNRFALNVATYAQWGCSCFEEIAGSPRRPVCRVRSLLLESTGARSARGEKGGRLMRRTLRAPRRLLLLTGVEAPIFFPSLIMTLSAR